MTYVILVLLFVGASAWAFYQGVQVEALKKDLERLKSYTDRQSKVIESLLRSETKDHELQEVLDKLDATTNPDEYSKLLNAYLSGSGKSPNPG